MHEDASLASTAVGVYSFMLGRHFVLFLAASLGVLVKWLFLLMSVDSLEDSWNPIKPEAADLSD